MLDLLRPHVLAALGVVMALGVFAGWWLRQLGERVRKQALEAEFRERANAAARARDRARQETAEVQRRLAELKADHAKRDDRLLSLEESSRRDREREAQATKRVRELEQELERSVEQTRQAESRLGSLATALEEARKARTAAERTGVVAREELSATRKELDGRQVELDQRLGEIAQLQDQVQGQEQTLGEVRSRLEQSLSSTAAAEARANEEQSRTVELERRLERQVSREGELESTIEELESRLQDEEATVSKMRSALEQRDADFAGTLDAKLKVEADLGSARSRIDEQEVEIQELATRLEASRAEQVASKRRIGQLEKELAGLEALRQELRLEREQTRELKDRILTAASEKGALNRTLKQQGTRLESVAAELESARAASDARRQEARQLAERIDDLQEALRERDESLAELAPDWLLGTPDGPPDDLKAIRGLGPTLEQRLNEIGVFHHAQLAQATALDIHWISTRLGVPPGRIARDRWVAQAKRFSARGRR